MANEKELIDRKLQYLSDTKDILKNAIIEKGQAVFRARIHVGFGARKELRIQARCRCVARGRPAPDCNSRSPRICGKGENRAAQNSKKHIRVSRLRRGRRAELEIRAGAVPRRLQKRGLRKARRRTYAVGLRRIFAVGGRHRNFPQRRFRGNRARRRPRRSAPRRDSP